MHPYKACSKETSSNEFDFLYVIENNHPPRKVEITATQLS